MILENILPILVLYKQNLRDSISLKALSDHLTKNGKKLDLFVYDNSPFPSELSQFEFKQFNICYIHDKMNSGVSKAYNSGARYAAKINKTWLLLLDQDTKFPENFITDYLTAVEKNPDIPIFCPILQTQYGHIMSPCLYIRKRGVWVKHIKQGILNFNKYSPVNSGLMIYLEAFNKAGGYNESVRLDFADFQFIEKIRNYYSRFFLIDMVCIQEFSGFEKDVSVLESRFRLYCEGARNCKRKNTTEDIWYLIEVLRRLAGLTIKAKTLVFFPIFFKEYLLKK